MSLVEELLEHAQFLASLDEQTTSQANIRRAISASYYAVFHLLSAAVAEQVSPGFPAGLRECTQRALSHSQMFNVAKAFSQQGQKTVKSLPKGFVLPDPISAELASIASDFQELQEARHAADYDVLRKFDPVDAISYVQEAEKVFKDWETEKHSKNAPVFLAALIFGKDWNK
jgi:uncharacterized protein (UPF0332 family)